MDSLAAHSRSMEACWFCGGKAEIDRAVSVIMEKSISYESHDYGSVAYSSHKFRETTVSVPRCSRCKNVHERWNRWMERGITYALVALPLLTLTNCGFAMHRGEPFWPWVGRGLLLILGGVFFFAGVGAAAGFVWPTGRVRRVWHGKQHPSVLQLMKEGWLPSGNQDYFGTNVTREWGRTRVND